MNYRANIVIFHEITPLSARSSKKEDAKRGTGAHEMAKTGRKTGGRRGCGSCIGSSVRPRTAHLPKRAGSGKREERAAGPTEEQSGTIAEPPLRSLARRRSDRKKEEQTAQALGTFSTYRGAFRRSPPPRPPPHADERSEVGKTDEKALARTRAQHRVSVFRLHPSAVIRWFTTRYG